jgi:uncharacterized protein (DUF58 family)
MSMLIVLDSSASMAFPESGVSKFDYARLLAASLAYLAIVQGDAVGLMTMDSKGIVYLPPRGGRPHLRLLTATMDNLVTHGSWSPERLISRSAELLKRRGALFVISDFYDAEEETRRALRRAVHVGQDVAMLQVLSAEELTLTYRGEIEMEDLESGTRRLISAEEAAPRYANDVAAFLARCRSGAQQDGVEHALFTTDEPPGRALRNYLLKRIAAAR